MSTSAMCVFLQRVMHFTILRLQKYLDIIAKVHPILMISLYILLLYLKFSFALEYKSSVFPYILCYLSAIIPAFIIRLSAITPSYIAILLLYTILYIPVQMFSPLIDSQIKEEMVYFNICVLLSFCALIFMINRNIAFKCRLIRLPNFNISPWIIRAIFTVGIVIMFSIFNIPDIYMCGLSNMYNVRIQSREILLNSLLPFAPIIIAVYQNIFCIFGIIFAIQKRDWVLLFLATCMQFYIAIATCQYGALILPAAALFIYFSIKIFKTRIGVILLNAQTIFIVLYQILKLCIDIKGDLVFRTYYYHIVLSNKYVSFFNQKGFTYLAESKIIALLLGIEQSKSPAKIIGEQYYSSTNWANENFWATAFANFGFIGIFAVTLILYVLFSLYDYLTRTKDYALASAILAFSAMILTSSGLQTALLSGGMMIIYLLIFIIPNKNRIS